MFKPKMCVFYGVGGMCEMAPGYFCENLEECPKPRSEDYCAECGLHLRGEEETICEACRQSLERTLNEINL